MPIKTLGLKLNHEVDREEILDDRDDHGGDEVRISSSQFPNYPHPDVARLPPTTFEVLKENFFVIMYGVRRTGKTHAITCLLEGIKDRFDFAYLFSATANLHKGEKGELNFDMIREEAKFPGYDPDILQRIFDRQQRVKEFNNACKDPKDKKPNSTLLIFDDFVHDPAIRYSTLFTKLPVLGRHYDLSVICLTQGYSAVANGGLNKATRQNADWVGTFLPRNRNDLERISEWYLTQSKNENMWFTRSVCEQEHQLLGINLSEPHLTKLVDFCTKYKGPAKVPEYELGKVQWHIAREEEKRNKASAIADDAKRAQGLMFATDEELEVRGQIGECTGLPDKRTKMTMYDAFLAKGNTMIF